MTVKKSIVILLHGGAGSGPPTRNQQSVLRETLELGWEILKSSGTSLDTVENTIQRLEDSNVFNAGRGGKLQLDGHQRLDASLMEGRDLKAGAVAALEGIANPISAARRVMERSPHVLLVAEGAMRFSKIHRLKRLDSPSEMDLSPARSRRRAGEALETVGAVALDVYGNLAAGASTGGISNMQPGRVGDSPLIGSGVYADNQGAAVSMTGIGEGIIRAGLAKEISFRVQQGSSPRQAARLAFRRLVTRLQGSAGAIALDRAGRFVILHTTPYMVSGYKNNDLKFVVAPKFSTIR